MSSNLINSFKKKYKKKSLLRHNRTTIVESARRMADNEQTRVVLRFRDRPDTTAHCSHDTLKNNNIRRALSSKRSRVRSVISRNRIVTNCKKKKKTQKAIRAVRNSFLRQAGRIVAV